MFATHLVFPEYAEDARKALARGTFRKPSNGLGHLPAVSKQLLEGLGYMHSLNIIHRDLKPGNILVAPSGTGAAPTVVISDCGSALLLEETDAGHCGLRQTAVGTYQYRAPELFAERPLCDAYTDIWALGCTIVEMATLKTPFGRDRLRRSEMGIIFSRS